MADEKVEKGHPGVLVEIYRSIPKVVLGILVAGVGFVLFFVVMIALPHLSTAIPAYIKSFTGSPPGLQQCWELKEVQAGVYRFNRCTGETQRVELPTASTPASLPATPATTTSEAK